jgi:hypothetical protein
MSGSDQVPTEVREVSQQIAEPKPMRRGSLSTRFVKCSKPGCACSQSAEGRHGPYYSLTKAVKGQTRSRLLTAAQAEIAQRQIEAGRRFREQTEAFWRASEDWADRELSEAEAAPERAVKKRGSEKRSKRRRPPKSKL